MTEIVTQEKFTYKGFSADAPDIEIRFVVWNKMDWPSRIVHTDRWTVFVIPADLKGLTSLGTKYLRDASQEEVSEFMDQTITDKQQLDFLPTKNLTELRELKGQPTLETLKSGVRLRARVTLADIPESFEIIGEISPDHNSATWSLEKAVKTHFPGCYLKHRNKCSSNPSPFG